MDERLVADRARPAGGGPTVTALGSDLVERAVTVWDGRLELTVQVAGQGPPLLYLHPAAGLHWTPFHEHLATHHTVYAPRAPGTTPGRPEAIGEVDDLWDLVLAYEELVRALGLERPVVIGESFGGMLACELAAHFPDLFSRMIVVAPIGLWLDDHPVTNWVATAPEDVPALLFHDPQGEAARAASALPDDPDAAIAAIASVAWAIGCTAKFVWPIPDKGLSKRLHRITVPTLVVWGRQDALVPSAYAEEFGRRIPGSRVEVLDDCGHIPPAEQPERTRALVDGFLGVA
jgi:pimeloyl-ACP methyl ester carboxylesterase